MKSLRFRILIIFLVVFLCSSFATWMISEQIAHEIAGDFFEGSMRLELQQARAALAAGGKPALQQYLAESDSVLHGTRYLLDAQGRDIVYGTDHSRALTALPFAKTRPQKVNGQYVVVMASPDGKYSLLVIAPPLPTKRFIPYFILLTLAIAFLGWFLSISIVSPLTRVAATVEKFGRGDLKARVRSLRKDEIGDLGRSFDVMADRIETLLTAERRLLQDVSHELRSPLARLSFAAELMRGAANPDEALSRMRREIIRLTQLINNLLEVTRMEGDPSVRDAQRFSFASLMREVLEDCSFEAEARNISIASNIHGPLTMEGNTELIRRAVENVLRNAIRFSAHDSKIQADVAEDATGIVVAVKDSGPGVPDEMLTGIFDPFVRADESRDSSSGGIGLGLSIARRAVLLHHGAISAQNLHPGLLVTIQLPTAGLGTS